MTNQRWLAPYQLAAGLLIALLLATGAAPWPPPASANPDGIIEWFGGTHNNWPADNRWVAIPALNDPRDGVAEKLDFVGDSSDPGVYYYSTSSYLYLRIRVDIGTVTSGTYTDAILVLIDKDRNGSIDYGFGWDSKLSVDAHGLEMLEIDTQGTTWSGTKMDDVDGSNSSKLVPDFNNGSRTGDGYVRTVDGQATTNFGTTTFIDIAASWSYLSTYLNDNLTPDPGLDVGQTWAIQIGSIANATDHNNITTDVGGGQSPGSSVSLPGELSTNPLAVTLESFTAQPQDSQILVSWETTSELDNRGFNLYRGQTSQAPELLLAFIPSQSQGNPGGFAYSYLDAAVQPGETYWYWLEDVAFSGQTALHGPVSATAATPTVVGLNELAAGSAAPALPLTGILLALTAALMMAVRHKSVQVSDCPIQAASRPSPPPRAAGRPGSSSCRSKKRRGR